MRFIAPARNGGVKMIDNALLTHRRMYPEMFYRPYRNPKGTGWLGYIEADNGDALGFVRTDGFVVWDWEPRQQKEEAGDLAKVSEALDALGLALAGHEHKWSEKERQLYEEAIALTKAAIKEPPCDSSQSS